MVDTSLVTQLASEGYHTLQVPQFAIDPFGPNSTDYTDYATDYLIPVKSGGLSNRIAAGREVPYAFMYLSRKGWKHFKADIKSVFDPCRGTWQEFEAAADKFLDKLEALTQKELAKTQALNAVAPTTARKQKEQDFIKFLKRM